MRDFADARHRLRVWVAICGTKLDRDRPTRQAVWPGEAPDAPSGEVEIRDRAADFAEVVLMPTPLHLVVHPIRVVADLPRDEL